MLDNKLICRLYHKADQCFSVDSEMLYLGTLTKWEYDSVALKSTQIFLWHFLRQNTLLSNVVTHQEIHHFLNNQLISATTDRMDPTVEPREESSKQH